MRWTGLAALGGLMLAGCFDEGGDEAKVQSASAVADGILAFAEIKNNIPANPGPAGEALLRFIQTPVAAENLISPPGELSDLGAQRLSAPAPIPDCMTTMGSEGCDSFATNQGTTCEAGPFTFTGSASRMCSPCTDLMGTCTYDWNLTVRYVVPNVDLSITTDGPVTTTLSSIEFDTTFTYMLNANGETRSGSASIKSCGAAMLSSSAPKKLVNSKFVVRSIAIPTRCALVTFDGAGTPSVGRCAAGTGCP